jgi:hypothetical protein
MVPPLAPYTPWFLCSVARLADRLVACGKGDVGHAVGSSPDRRAHEWLYVLNSLRTNHFGHVVRVGADVEPAGLSPAAFREWGERTGDT